MQCIFISGGVGLIQEFEVKKTKPDGLLKLSIVKKQTACTINVL